MTREHIQQVMSATDAAAINRDAAAIGDYLGQSFERIIEFTYKDWTAKIRLDRDKYLEMISDGWTQVGEYSYQRDNVEIHLSPDRLSGLSYSTVTERMVQDGEEMISRFREHATYELENGRPVITQVSGHTLLGDTTPQ
jgi:hypothetical protein